MEVKVDGKSATIEIGKKCQVGKYSVIVERLKDEPKKNRFYKERFK